MSKNNGRLQREVVELNGAAKKLLELQGLQRPRSSLAASCAAGRPAIQSQGHEGPTVTPRLFRGLAGTSRRPALGVAS